MSSFWKHKNKNLSVSNIKELLDDYKKLKNLSKHNLNLIFEIFIKLLDSNDLMEELILNNPLLIEFMRLEEVLCMLVDFIIHEGNIDVLIKKFIVETKNDKIINDQEIIKNCPDIKKDESMTKYEPTSEDQKDFDKFCLNEIMHDYFFLDFNLIKNENEKYNENKNENLDENFNEKKNKNENFDEKIKISDEPIFTNNYSIKNDYKKLNFNQENIYFKDESEQYKALRRFSISAEILSADVWSLTDIFMESTHNLNKLWAIFDQEKSISLNLSISLMKIMEHLLDVKCDEMINYLFENQNNLVKKFMNHISNPPLIDYILKLISTDKPEHSTGIIDFLQNQNLISSLLDILAVSIDYENDNDNEQILNKQSCAADFLKALITISSNSVTDTSTIGPNDLTRELVSFEKINRLCDIMLKGGYFLSNGVGIVIELIRKNNSDYDMYSLLYVTLESHPPTSRDPIYLGHLLKVFGNKIDKFDEILTKKNYMHNNILKTSFGEVEPLGFEKFKICELIAELIHCSNMILINNINTELIVRQRDQIRIDLKRKKLNKFNYITLSNTDNFENCFDNNKNNDIEPIDNEISNMDNNYNNKHTKKIKQSCNSRTKSNQLLIDKFSKIEGDTNNLNELILNEEFIRNNPVIGDFLKVSLYDTQIITNIITMFFKFPWNNFLHNVVYDIIQQILNGSMEFGFNKYLAIDLLNTSDITSKIVEGQKLCNDFEKKNNGLRLGFMGHLNLISEEIIKFTELFSSLSFFKIIEKKIKESNWENYINNELIKTRNKYNLVLGGNREVFSKLDVVLNSLKKLNFENNNSHKNIDENLENHKRNNNRDMNDYELDFFLN